MVIICYYVAIIDSYGFSGEYNNIFYFVRSGYQYISHVLEDTNSKRKITERNVWKCDALKQVHAAVNVESIPD